MDMPIFLINNNLISPNFKRVSDLFLPARDCARTIVLYLAIGPYRTLGLMMNCVIQNGLMFSVLVLHIF